MLYSELKCKDVIDIRSCKKLGKVSDLEFEECSGCIRKLFVPRLSMWEKFLQCKDDYEIPYCDIKHIGPDIILVDMPKS